jgi:Protein SCAI
MQEAEYKEWKHAMQEITKFLKADTPFMNKRPLRYNFAFDTPPDSLLPVGPTITAVTKRNLLLRDALLTSHYFHEVAILFLLHMLTLY